MTRVGLLGGTFDPPHVAHIAMARAARERLRLDRLYFCPAPTPPHKSTGDVTPYQERLKMTEIVAELAGAEVSRVEEGGEGPSYTVDLLRKYAGPGIDLYFIMGADSLHDLPGWRNPEIITEMCTLVVFPRDDIPMRAETEGGMRMVAFEEPRIDVSSRDIRARLERGESVDSLVPPEVLAHIATSGLYHR